MSRTFCTLPLPSIGSTRSPGDGLSSTLDMSCAKRMYVPDGEPVIETVLAFASARNCACWASAGPPHRAAIPAKPAIIVRHDLRARCNCM